MTALMKGCLTRGTEMVVRGSPECFCLRPSRADMARNAAMINNKASIISLEMSFCVGYKCDLT